MNDDPTDQQRRDELIRGLTLLDAIRAGRGAPSPASRLDILGQAGQPPGKATAVPHLRVIQGGKA